MSYRLVRRGQTEYLVKDNQMVWQFKSRSIHTRKALIEEAKKIPWTEENEARVMAFKSALVNEVDLK